MGDSLKCLEGTVKPEGRKYLGSDVFQFYQKAESCIYVVKNAFLKIGARFALVKVAPDAFTDTAI